MKLFKFEGYNLTISEEAFMLKPFKDLWTRDKSKGKDKALQELCFIYMMEDPRSDYQTYLDRDERMNQIKLGEGIKESWQPDDKVKEAMEFYASFKPEAALLLEDIRKSIAILRTGLVTQEELADIDIEKKPRILDAYANVISKLTKLTRELDETEKAITRDITQNDKVRGAAEKSIYEDI